jgi:hypothetical protein
MKHMIKMKVGDWLILLFSLVLIPLSWSMTKHQQDSSSAIEISVSDKQTTTYSIKKDQKIKIAGDIGESIIEIDDGKVRFSSSPCSAKICILSGWHQHSGDHIVCLPNKLSVSLLSQEDRFDGINF